MKMDKKTISLLLIVFALLALFVAVPETFNSNAEQKTSLENARAYFEKDLCLLAIDEYKKAISEEDTLEIELELADVYVRAYENGEISNLSTLQSFYDDLVTNFREEYKVYDLALNFYYENEDYASVVELLTQAKKLKVSSDIILQMTEDVRYKYFEMYSAISDMERSISGYYTVKDGERYSVYNENFSAVFSNLDYACVYVNDYLVAKKGEYVYIMNSEGKRVAYLDKDIDFSTGFGGNLFGCRNNEKYSYYNISGEKVFGEYLFAGRFKEGYAAVQTEEGWSIIDTEGNVITNRYFEDIKCGPSYECVTDGCFFAKENGKYALYNLKGESVGDLKFDDCDYFLNSTSYAAVMIGEKWGFINIKGESVIECKFDCAKSFSNGLAFVLLSEEGGFINENGEIVITDDFSDADYFNSKGICLIKNDAIWRPIERYYTAD